MFGEIRRNEQLPARIASEIVRQITEGSFLPGQKLPTEHNLAQSFGVSRSVIREAIAQLRNEGLIETRQGVGAKRSALNRKHSLTGIIFKACFSFVWRWRLKPQASPLCITQPKT